MTENYPVKDGKYKPEETWGNDCHCPEPVVSEDGKRCVECNGLNPLITKKKGRRKR